jgi:hypothetical protein
MRQPGVGIRGQQFIQSDALFEAEIGGQRPVRFPAGTMAHGRCQPVEHGQGRGQDAPLSKLIQESFDQREAAIRAPRHREQPGGHLPVFLEPERPPTERGHQLGQVLPSGLIPPGVAREVVRCDAELAGDIAQHELGDRFRRRPGAARVAQEAELDREAQTVLVAATLGDQIQIRRRERVALGDPPGIGRQHQELSVLSGREDFLSGHL